MKRIAGMFAVLLATAAYPQSPDPAAATTPAVTSSAASVIVPEEELATATSILKDAFTDFTHCRRPSACDAYFESFGVAISFGDGQIAPFAHLQRLKATSRDCIKNARASLDHGDRNLALQWAMAARIENIRIRDWMGSHPDAVLEALRRCCS